MEKVAYTLDLKVFSSLLYYHAENFISQRRRRIVFQNNWRAITVISIYWASSVFIITCSLYNNLSA